MSGGDPARQLFEVEPEEQRERSPEPRGTWGRGRRRMLIRGALVASDAAMLLAALLAATFVRFGRLGAFVSFEHHETSLTFVELSILVVPLWLCLLALEHLYDLDRLFWGAHEFSGVVRALSLGVVGFILLTFTLKLPGLSRGWTILSWALSIAFVCAGRIVVRAGLRWLRRRGVLCRRTLIVGSNDESAALARVFSTDPGSGFEVVGTLASSQAERLALNFVQGHPCLGFARELVDVVERHEIDNVVIASSAFDHGILTRMINELRGRALDIHISSGLFDILTQRVLVREVAGMPMITVKGISLSRRNLLTKRVFDLVVACTVIAAGMPLWVVLVALIKVTSAGPVFYRQERIGKDGVLFGMLKFRSMYADADKRLAELQAANEATGPLFKMRNDPRVTPVGRWMRKFSVDEFPQLINVVRGEMSLVGPRPPLQREALQYTDHDWQRMRVLPGMTGLWQVSGRSNLTFDEMVRLDLFYIENWSVALDLGLLARTLPAVVLGSGAY